MIFHHFSDIVGPLLVLFKHTTVFFSIVITLFVVVLLNLDEVCVPYSDIYYTKGAL